MRYPTIDQFGTHYFHNENGKMHREDGPAYIHWGGVQAWYINGERYRDTKSYQEAAKLSDEDMLMITLKYGNVK
jgi:hypothetical protein